MLWITVWSLWQAGSQVAGGASRGRMMIMGLGR
jgi:hypothetical protein